MFFFHFVLKQSILKLHCVLQVGSHDLNKDSSRSHCIMTLHVDSITEIEGGSPIVRYGKMLFVDLAGSERLKKSRSSGDMLKETGNINRSLFTLGKVTITSYEMVCWCYAVF
mgnify:CR=1 FL=1